MKTNILCDLMFQNRMELYRKAKDQLKNFSWEVVEENVM